MGTTTARIWVGAFAVAVFACGLAAGVLLGQRMGPGGGPALEGLRGGPGGPPGRGAAGPGLVERIAEDLDLTAQQRTALETLFGSRRERFRAFNEEMRQRFEREQAEMRGALAQILTPDQLQRFDERMVRVGDERRRRPGERGRPGRGEPGRPPDPPRPRN